MECYERNAARVGIASGGWEWKRPQAPPMGLESLDTRGGAENSGDSDNDEVQARTEQPRILRGQGERECPDDENSL